MFKKIIFTSSLVASILGNSFASDFPPQIPGSPGVDFEYSTAVNPITGETITTKKASSITITLDVGWNLISIPGYSRFTADDLFFPKTKNGMAIDSSITAVYVFDKISSDWKTYYPGGRNNTINTLKPGEGFWVNAKYRCAFKFESKVPVDGFETVEFIDGINSDVSLPPQPWN